MSFRFPTTQQRMTIVGRTGTGKTQAGVWFLSHAPYDEIPYVIVDFKGDELINDIPGLRDLKFKDGVPKEPGLYRLRAAPHDEAEIEKFFYKVWAKGDCGLFIDECYMIDKNSPAMQACLTQGRSLHIPMINLSQRPVQVSRFVFSEADFHCVFHLNDRRDRKTVQEYMETDLDQRLPDFHSRFYDVGLDKIYKLTPVPDRNRILTRFEGKLKPRTRFFV
jgi:hypothetical protein